MSSAASSERINKLHGVFDEKTVFRKLTAEEYLGKLFSVNVELLSTKGDISPYDTIGKSLGIEIALTDSPRYFHGIISHFELVSQIGRYFLYRLTLRPWLWLLTHTSDCRIHQEQDASKIIEFVFRTKNGLTDFQSKLTKTFVTREFCVQYRESDFAFISRLMEQEGIYYYFDSAASDHKLMMVDDVSSHPTIDGDKKIPFRPPNNSLAADEHIFEWKHRLAIQPGKFTFRDFDYNKPNVDLEVRLNSDRTHPHASFERFDYPGLYSETSDGTSYLRVLSERHSAEHAQIIARAKSVRIKPGYVFELVDHPATEENGEYLVVSTKTTISSSEIDQGRMDSENEANVEFVAIKKSTQFRMPPSTPRPLISGPQTAKVVGKQGEEIWTDSLGRVKVQFPWDRIGKSDENSSCWIRVAQIWSGKSWGAMFIPRIGQEVIVEFLEGDPDRPLITGRVYNTDLVVPYVLPGESATSGIKSRSTPGGGTENYNELRFVDKKDEELVHFHAEKNFDRVVENNDTLKVGFEKKDKGDQSIEVFNNQTTKIGTSESTDGSQTIEVFNNQKLTVGTSSCPEGSQTVEIWKDQKETIKTGDRTTTIDQGSDKLTISAGNQTVSIPSGTCLIEAGQKITLKVGGTVLELTPAKASIEIGGSSVVMDAGSITLKSASITTDASIAATIKAATGEFNASAMLVLKGGIVQIN